MKSLSIIEADLLAAQFRSTRGIGLAEPINAKTLIRMLGVTVMYRPLSEKSYGISCMSMGKRFILVNSNSTRGRQHFTIAHELYHLYYDERPTPHICDSVVTTEEKNANRFAASLLMPREGILSMVSKEEIAQHSVYLSTVLRMEQLFGVSRITLLIRLKDLGLINQHCLDKLKSVPVKDSALEYGYDLSLYQPGNEGLFIGNFGEKARLLFEQDKISEGHYIELLNMIRDGMQEED